MLAKRREMEYAKAHEVAHQTEHDEIDHEEMHEIEQILFDFFIHYYCFVILL